MRITLAALLITFAVSAGLAHGQAAKAVQGVAHPEPPPAPAAPVAPSSLLKPSLTLAGNTLTGLNLDKWKKGSVRAEAETNVSSLLHDLHTNMPPLLSAADASPGDLSKSIPLLKHLDAFYDVLLRVEEASRVSAPGEQINALQLALLDVNKARTALDDHLADQAASQQAQVMSLETDLRSEKDALARERNAASVPVSAPCAPATPAHRKRRSTTTKTPSTSTPTQKPGTPPPATQKPQQ